LRSEFQPVSNKSATNGSYLKYLIIILKEVDQEDDQETGGGIVYKQTLRSVKLTTGKKGKKTELNGKGPLRRRRSALDCSATEEEEQEEEERFLPR
jgi:hypothetical protein